MKSYKKRTIALILASVITVAGSFAAENYKNSLMALNFESGSDGAINIVLETKVNLTDNISPIKRDSNTYVIMLPEVNSKAQAPDLTKAPGNISNVSISTLPYTTTGKGYTKITVKTISPTTLYSKNKIFIPTTGSTTQKITNTQYKPKKSVNNLTSINTANKQNEQEEFIEEINEETEPIKEEVVTLINSNDNDNIAQEIAYSDENKNSKASQIRVSNSSNERITLILGILLVATCVLYFCVKAKNNILEATGEKLEIDVTEENDLKKEKEKEKAESKKKNLKKIKDTVKTLDATYSKTAVPQSSIQKSVPLQQPIPDKIPQEDINIVDLDFLFQESQKQEKEQEENLALEEFLSGFSYLEEENLISEEKIQERVYFDEDKFNEIINSDTLKFSEEDINCINKLLDVEVNINTVNKIKKRLVTSPIKKALPKEKILEDLVLNYAISLDIKFTNDDINILYKLMNVELDNDFVTDLRTSAARTKQMQQEILNASENSIVKQPILLLDVKDELSDSSKETIKTSYITTPENICSSQPSILNPENSVPKEDLLDKTPIGNQAEQKILATESTELNTQKATKTQPEKPTRSINKEVPNTTTNKTFNNIKKCSLNGIPYTITSTVVFADNIGCHLAKSENEYIVLAFNANKIFKIKSFETLKSEKIQARLNVKLADNTHRYIVRIGINKFIVDVKENNIKYVIDLC